MEVLRWASEAGADAINYMSCEGLRRRAGRVVGAKARCQLTNEVHSFSARHVVNCGGPWARDIAAQASANIHDDPGLALAFNILVDRIPLSEHALAVTPPHPHARGDNRSISHGKHSEPSRRCPVARCPHDIATEVTYGSPAVGK